MRKPTFCICENKDADQLHSDCAADRRLCFRYKDRKNPSTFLNRNIKSLAIFCSCTAWYMSNQVGNQSVCFLTSWLKCSLYCRLNMKALLVLCLAVSLTAVAATHSHQSSAHRHKSSAHRHQSKAHSHQTSAYRHQSSRQRSTHTNQSSAARSFLLYVREKMANVGIEITEIRDKIDDCCNQAGQ